MPPGRRGRPAGSSSTSKTAQKTLTFGPNSSNKISKPTQSQSQTHTKKLSPVQTSALSSSSVVAGPNTEADLSAPGSPSAEEVDRESEALPIRHQQEAATRQRVEREDPREMEASKVPQAQIRKYWQMKEEARIAPRVHQQGLGVHEKVLREFDLSYQFGPCIGIPRMKRWKRADNLGLKPPLEVLAVLMKEEEKGTKGVETPYMDTLMGRLGGLDP